MYPISMGDYVVSETLIKFLEIYLGKRDYNSWLQRPVMTRQITTGWCYWRAPHKGAAKNQYSRLQL